MTEFEQTDGNAQRREFLKKLGLSGAAVSGAEAGSGAFTPPGVNPDMTTTREGLEAADAGTQEENGGR